MSHDHDHTSSATHTAPEGDLAVCPVMPANVVIKRDAEAAGLFRDYQGERYWLCCGGCGPRFDVDPDRFAAAARTLPSPDEVLAARPGASDDHASHEHSEPDHYAHAHASHGNDAHAAMGHGAHGGHGGHGGHAGHGDHVGQFRRLFWIMLAFAVPVVAFSGMFSMLLGYRLPDLGWVEWISPVLGTVMFFWGGWPFLTGAVAEVRALKPGMMLLIGLALTVAFVASLGATFGVLDHQLDSGGSWRC